MTSRHFHRNKLRWDPHLRQKYLTRPRGDGFDVTTLPQKQARMYPRDSVVQNSCHVLRHCTRTIQTTVACLPEVLTHDQLKSSSPERHGRRHSVTIFNINRLFQRTLSRPYLSDGANATCDNNTEQEPTVTDRASRHFGRTTLRSISATVFQNNFSYTSTQHKIYRRPFLTHSQLDLSSVERHRYRYSMQPTEPT